MSSCSIFEMKTKWPSLANPLSLSLLLLPSCSTPATSVKRLEFVCQALATVVTLANCGNKALHRLSTTQIGERRQQHAEAGKQSETEREREGRLLCVCGVPVQEFSYVFATYNTCNMQHAATTCGTYTQCLQQLPTHSLQIGVYGHFCFCPKKKELYVLAG